MNVHQIFRQAIAGVRPFGLDQAFIEEMASRFMLLHVRQPIVDLKTGITAGFELLVRWQRFPGVMPLAMPLSQDVVRLFDLYTASRALDAAKREEGEFYTFNVEPSSLADPWFVEKLLYISSTCTPDTRRRTVLELTERCHCETCDDLSGSVRTLRSHGISVALDDFGAGQNGLSMLSRMPVDMIKMDAEFTQKAVANKRFLHVAQSTIEMARGLELPVVAEAIETPEQAALWLSMGASFGQGYLFGHPATLD